MGLIFTLVYFFLAYMVARFYRERGQSPALGFLLSVVISPFFGLLIGLLLGKNYSRMPFSGPQQEPVNAAQPEIIKPAPPEETPEQRSRREKKERMIFLGCIIGLLLFAWGVISFIGIQVKNVRQVDSQQRELRQK